jgi:hypothetical protein
MCDGSVSMSMAALPCRPVVRQDAEILIRANLDSRAYHGPGRDRLSI